LCVHFVEDTVGSVLVVPAVPLVDPSLGLTPDLQVGTSTGLGCVIQVGGSSSGLALKRIDYYGEFFCNVIVGYDGEARLYGPTGQVESTGNHITGEGGAARSQGTFPYAVLMTRHTILFDITFGAPPGYVWAPNNYCAGGGTPVMHCDFPVEMVA
jgi:hypothetical protein